VRHIYRIYDGGEFWDYSADSREQAADEHISLNYINTGVPVEDGSPQSPQQLPDDQMLTVGDAGPKGETITKSCADWARAEEGLIATTCF
jgi:hypothetical protein